MNDEPIRITCLVTEVLERIGVKYLIAGSLASAIYGEPRSTRDADILADLRLEHIDQIYQALEPSFNISKEAIENAIYHRSSFNAIHYDSLFKVDVFVPSREFDQQELQRRTLHVVARDPEKLAYVASVEDVVLSKLDWYRKGNEVSEQQWRDVLGIFKANEGRLDREYLLKTGRELGVLDLLQKLIPTT